MYWQHSVLIQWHDENNDGVIQMFKSKLRMYRGKLSETIEPEFSRIMLMFEKFGECEFIGGCEFKNKNGDIIEVHDISMTKRCFRVKFHEEDILCVIGPDRNMYFVNPWVTALYTTHLEWNYSTEEFTGEPIALNRLSDSMQIG